MRSNNSITNYFGQKWRPPIKIIKTTLVYAKQILKPDTTNKRTFSETNPNANLLNFSNFYGNAKTTIYRKSVCRTSSYKHGNDHYSLLLAEKFAILTADPKQHSTKEPNTKLKKTTPKQDAITNCN